MVSGLVSELEEQGLWHYKGFGFDLQAMLKLHANAKCLLTLCLKAFSTDIKEYKSSLVIPRLISGETGGVERLMGMLLRLNEL